MRTRSGRAQITLLVALVAALAAPAGAQAYSTVTMLSEPGDYIGGGVDRHYHPGNGAVGIFGTPASVHVSVSSAAPATTCSWADRAVICSSAGPAGTGPSPAAGTAPAAASASSGCADLI